MSRHGAIYRFQQREHEEESEVDFNRLEVDQVGQRKMSTVAFR
jgi:hypothetical protein